MITDELPIDLYPEPSSNNYRADSIANIPNIVVPKHGLRITVAAGPIENLRPILQYSVFIGQKNRTELRKPGLDSACLL